MRCAKGVVDTFVTARKARQPTKLTQAAHAVAPTGENFMRIRLVTHVPDDAVFRGIKNVMQRDGELNGAKIGGQMPSSFGDRFKQIITQLNGELIEVGAVKLAQRSRIVNIFE